MIRRPPRSTLDRSSAASDVYKRQDNIESEYKIEVKIRTIDSSQMTNMEVSDFTPSIENEKLNAEAVSYTHLRAHETVLDLVCRLLLEKKKKKKQKKHTQHTHTHNTHTHTHNR